MRSHHVHEGRRRAKPSLSLSSSVVYSVPVTVYSLQWRPSIALFRNFRKPIAWRRVHAMARGLRDPTHYVFSEGINGMGPDGAPSRHPPRGGGAVPRDLYFTRKLPEGSIALHTPACASGHLCRVQRMHIPMAHTAPTPHLHRTSGDLHMV